MAAVTIRFNREQNNLAYRVLLAQVVTGYVPLIEEDIHQIVQKDPAKPHPYLCAVRASELARYTFYWLGKGIEAATALFQENRLSKHEATVLVNHFRNSKMGLLNCSRQMPLELNSNDSFPIGAGAAPVAASVEEAASRLFRQLDIQTRIIAEEWERTASAMSEAELNEKSPFRIEDLPVYLAPHPPTPRELSGPLRRLVANINPQIESDLSTRNQVAAETMYAQIITESLEHFREPRSLEREPPQAAGAPPLDGRGGPGAVPQLDGRGGPGGAPASGS